MKRKSYNLDLLSPTEIYELLLQGKIGRFPNHFWEGGEGIEHAKEVTKYMIENLLHWKKNDIIQQISVDTFIENKLRGMLLIVFNGSPYLAIKTTYPGKFEKDEFLTKNNKYAYRYWNADNSKEKIKDLIENQMKWTQYEVTEFFNAGFLKTNQLNSLLDYFDGSIYMALNHAYPGTFRVWELKYYRETDLSKELGILAVKWLIEEKLKIPIKEIPQQLKIIHFVENNLNKILKYCFNSDAVIAIKEAYPNEYENKTFTIKSY